MMPMSICASIVKPQTLDEHADLQSQRGTVVLDSELL